MPNQTKLIANPWVELYSSDSPSYVLESDKAAVEAFNKKLKSGDKHAHFLHVKTILPEPFVGAKDAPVVLLSNNPGFNDNLTISAKTDSKFMPRIRGNLAHIECPYPLIYLGPDYAGSDWWDKKLHHVIEHFDLLGLDGRNIVARTVLNIVFFPYPSRRFGHEKLTVPSQAYSFHLVREAMKREAVIIHLRKADKWLERIPELSKYEHQFTVLNTQRPVITLRCPGFNESVAAIKKHLKL